MAGIFGLFDFTKEGKGVYADEPPRSAFAMFFVLLGRKFWKLISINLMYLLFSLPILILSMFAANYFLAITVPVLTVDNLAQVLEQAGFAEFLQEGVTIEEFAATQMLTLFITLGVMITGLSLIVSGPVHAGVTYILRNYSREEHAFVWMDFKDHARRNFRQSLLAGLFSLLVTIVFVFNLAFYSQSAFVGNPYLRTILFSVMLILFIFWTIMQMYLYPMMVTFNLSLRQLYKNAFLFTFMRLPLNLLILIASLFIVFVLPLGLVLLGYGISVLLSILWVALLAFAVNLLMTNLFVYRAMDKYMIQRLNQTEDAGAELDDPALATSSDDETHDEATEEDEEKDAASSEGLVRSPNRAPN
ncbi:MAG: DUF624 domain-containing protein [Clostridia bacterium]|nr:DUF624 domain-containing protein [Eubacteriales bacterium]MDD4461944.1 DUF624 domain-containing protein [Eubacteriales bacterium]NCC47894.1 DUF624 domain-containing protein [Clostridia bacterium]